MKFLLAAVNAKYIHSNLAVYSLRAFAREYQDNIEIKEFTINHRLEVILKDIYLAKPDVLLFSCYIWNINYIKELIQEVYKLLPEVKIWLGGPEAYYDGKALMAELFQVDGIMIGEGETSFRQLIKHYLGENVSLAEINGILYREAQQIVETGLNGIMDMSQIPFTYQNLNEFKNRIIYYESSRGCPFSCSYCLSSVDKRVRFREVDLVKRELDFFLENQVPQVKFVDRTFNCNHNHSLPIWEHIYQHDNGCTNFHFEIAADLINEAELMILEKMRPGLVQLEIGVQSTNEVTLAAIRRTMKFEKIAAIVERINSFQNIHIHLDLIAGLPFEDYQSFGKSFDDVYNLKPQQLQLGFLKVLKGSLMHEMASEYGIVYMNKAPYEVLYTNWLSYDEVLRLKSIEEIVEVYYNSGQFHHTLAALTKSFTSSFKMYEQIAAFFEDNGFFDRPHNRLDKYHFLHQFIEAYLPKQRQELENYLILDLYLRENVKSRPRFAADLSPYKEQIRNFFIKEQKQYQYLMGYENHDSRQLSKMAHVEVFQWQDRCEFMVFNYKRRDPLTYNAMALKIKEEDLWQ